MIEMMRAFEKAGILNPLDYNKSYKMIPEKTENVTEEILLARPKHHRVLLTSFLSGQ